MVKESGQGNGVAGIEGVEDLEAFVVAEQLGEADLGESAESPQAGMECTEAGIR